MGEYPTAYGRESPTLYERLYSSESQISTIRRLIRVSILIKLQKRIAEIPYLVPPTCSERQSLGSQVILTLLSPDTFS